MIYETLSNSFSSNMFFLKYLLLCSVHLWTSLEAASDSKEKRKHITPVGKSNIGSWDGAFSNESSLIPLIQFGEKSYYFGIYFAATFLEADQFCRDIHMELVRVQTKEENDFLYKYSQEKTKFEHFWTAGSKLLDKKNWIWMTTGEIIEYTNWGSGQPDNPNTELCLELWLFKNKGLFFNNLDCTIKIPFICERDKRRNYGSPQGSNSNWTGVFQNPSVSPNINLLHFEGKSYYFGTYFKATHLQAIQFCQIINMQLVSITSEAENSRIHKYLRDTGVVDSFWSSGSKAIDGKTWVWLSAGIKVEYTHWLPAQPDNVNERCLQLVQKKEDGLFWNDLTCTNQLFFICEIYDRVVPIVPPQLPPSGPGPVILPATTRTEVQPTAQYPENPSLPLTTVDGVTYRVSKIKATEEKASQTCKQYGMDLVSIKDQKKSDTVTKLISQSGNTGSGIGDGYWSSGKKQSDGKWVWGDSQPITFTNWSPGEPNNLEKNEFCLELYVTGQWNDLKCDQELYFICESSANQNSHQTCGSQPIINVYVNNNQCGNAKNATVTESKRIASSQDGYNVEVNNNIETCPKSAPHK